MRITLDTAILVRANHLATGPARALLLEILAQKHPLVISASILKEVERVLYYPRLIRLFGLSESDIIQFVTFLAALAEIAKIDETVATPIRDPNDVHVLRTAIGGMADYLCTLDGHFHEMPVVKLCSNLGITVISDLNLLRLIRQPSNKNSGDRLIS